MRRVEDIADVDRDLSLDAWLHGGWMEDLSAKEGELDRLVVFEALDGEGLLLWWGVEGVRV